MNHLALERARFARVCTLGRVANRQSPAQFNKMAVCGSGKSCELAPHQADMCLWSGAQRQSYRAARPVAAASYVRHLMLCQQLKRLILMAHTVVNARVSIGLSIRTFAAR